MKKMMRTRTGNSNCKIQIAFEAHMGGMAGTTEFGWQDVIPLCTIYECLGNEIISCLTSMIPAIFCRVIRVRFRVWCFGAASFMLLVKSPLLLGELREVADHSLIMGKRKRKWQSSFISG